jgi:LysM repeat protein
MLVVLVVLVHMAAIGIVTLSQGCGRVVDTTSTAGRGVTEDVILPPTQPVADVPAGGLGPETTPPPALEPDAKSWPAETTIYRVKRGETLSNVAARYGLSVEEIAALNNIKNRNMVREGQALVLPGQINTGAKPFAPRAPRPAPASVRVGPTAVPAAPVGASPVFAGAGSEYAVKSGDSLWLIARRHNTTVAALKQANSLTKDALKIGQKLVIPGAAAPATGFVAPPPPLPPPPVAPIVTEPVTGAPPASLPAPALEGNPIPAPEPAPVLTPAPAPIVPSAAAPSALAPPAGGETGGNYRIYNVAENEDLYAVSLLWNVPVERLKQVNGLTDTVLTKGQRLKIPPAE